MTINQYTQMFSKIDYDDGRCGRSIHTQQWTTVTDDGMHPRRRCRWTTTTTDDDRSTMHTTRFLSSILFEPMRRFSCFCELSKPNVNDPVILLHSCVSWRAI